MLEVRCPACNAAMPFVPELVGREVFCLGCGKHFVIPNIQSTPKQADHGRTFQTGVIDLTTPDGSKDDSGLH
jgi:hypothetical protein